MDKKIDALRKFFTITVAALEMQHTISLVFGFKEPEKPKSDIHLLHIKAKDEIEKENPDLDIIDEYLRIIKESCK